MRTDPHSIMIFAAGLGTRMGALTQTRPKPLINVAGRPLLDHALDIVRAARIETVVVNTHYFGEQIRNHLDGTDIRISDESELLLETGGGLRKALPLLGDGPVFTFNSDAIWKGPNVFDTLRAAWDPVRMDALLALIPPENAIGHKGRGDFIPDPEGRLGRGAGYVYTGAQIINPAGIGSVSEDAFSLNTLWDQMIAAGRVHGVIYDGAWCDVGRPESIALAESLLGHDDG